MKNEFSNYSQYNSTPSYHFIGIGGIGMSALARILLDQKIKVSGSDTRPSVITNALKKKGASIFEGHHPDNIKHGSIVVISSGIKNSNPELQEAIRLNCQIIHRSDLLNELMCQKQAIAIAGTHGKTTTSSLLSTVLFSAGCDPSFAVGGVIHQLADENEKDTFNGRQGSGLYFIAEADESDGTFLKYCPSGAIITNIEAEHLDYYQTEENVYRAFEQFFGQIKEGERLFYWGDDNYLTKIAKKLRKGYSYGFSKNCDLRIDNYKQDGWTINYTIYFEEKTYENIDVSLTGTHNALNSAAVFGLALKLGVSEKNIRSVLRNFEGVGRRCQKKGEVKEILFLDDYGHHPTEVQKTISAIKTAVKPRRLVVIFQPHRFTRTRDFFHEFSSSFDQADDLFITEIYSAGEEPIQGVSHQTIIDCIQKRKTVRCSYLPKENWLSIIESLQAKDVVLTLGAGTITQLGPELIKALNRSILC